LSADTLYYVAVNVGIGIGIAADAILATVARARTFASLGDALRWSGAIGLTHWLFPMIGFIGGWYAATHWIAAAAVYAAGGGLLLAYVLRVLFERSRHEIGQDARSDSRLSFWLAVWSVSIDALVTGPGKAAATAHWTTKQVIASFPFVGLVVFGLVLLATVPAMAVHRAIVNRGNATWRPLARFFVASTWVELLVFTWFAVLSFVEVGAAMSVVDTSYLLVSLATIPIGALMFVFAGRSISRAQTAAARHLLSATE
jgi:hypothetical protein